MERVWIEVRGDKKQRPHYRLDKKYCPRGRQIFVQPYGVDRWKITSSRVVNGAMKHFDLIDNANNARLYTVLKKAKQTAKQLADAARLKVVIRKVKKFV